MANNKKYISLNRLSNFLDNLKNTFALLSHKHTLSDITDYSIDSQLSKDSTNPVQNKVLDAEFEAVSTAMNALENAIDSKLNASDYVVDSELTSFSTNPVANKAVNDGINLVYDTMFSITDEKADIEHTHTKEDVGLGNVDNTADVEKSVNYATTAGAANSVEWKNVFNKPFSTTVNGTVVLPIVNVEESDDGNGIGRGSTGRFFSAVVSGEEYKVVFDGTEYYCVAYTDPIMNDYIVLGNFTIVEPITGATEHTDTGEPFLICYSIIYKYAGVYTATIDSHTVEITHVEEVVENIDESCIPDTIARVEDIPSVDGLATEAFVTNAASDSLTEAKSYADNAATTAANTVKNDLLNGAGVAYDTLKELGDLIDDNKDAIDALEDIAAGKANATHIHPYGVCSSSATYTTKTVTVDNFSLVEGVRVIVKFTNANSASSPKLNVNETGAIPIMRYGTTAAGSNTATNGWEAGAVLAFTYDGTNWVQDYWYNTTYTNASLGQGYGTCYTSSSTAEKTVSMSNYEDKTGGIVSIKFTYSVDAGATLNINSQGAMDIYYKGSAIIDDVIKGGDIATFICSGSTYHLISVDRWFEDITELQANDRRVRQMPTSTNGNFKLLLTPSFQSEDTTAYTYFDSGVYLNPYYNTLYGADIDGSATGVKGVTAGNFLVGNDDDTMVEKTPAEVLSMINGASVATMTTAEYNALEEAGTTNANTLYMLTDAEEESSNPVQIITWEDDD